MPGCQPAEDRDYTDTPFPGELPQPLPSWEIGLKIATCVLVELVAVVGNLVLIAVVARSPRMRTSTNCYIANMAVADLLVALGPMWIHVSTDVVSKDKDGWPLGAFLCKFNSFLQVTAMVGSVLTLVAIAGDRFIAITFPLKARVMERRVGLVVTLVWLSALGIGLPPLFFYTYRQREWQDYVETFCTDVWPAVSTGSGGCDQGLTSKRAYWTVVTVVLNWLPMAVMTAVYAVIIHRLRCCRLQPASIGRHSTSSVQRQSKTKVVKMLLVVLVAFMVCTIPFQVTNLYPLYSDHHLGDKLPAWHKPVSYAAVFLMYTNSAVNPILYGGLNDNFRLAARQLFLCLLCRGRPPMGLTASTHPAPRVSLVEDVNRLKVKAKPSLGRLVASATLINTALTAKGKGLGVGWVCTGQENPGGESENPGVSGSQEESGPAALSDGDAVGLPSDRNQDQDQNQNQNRNTAVRTDEILLSDLNQNQNSVTSDDGFLRETRTRARTRTL
ncbi:QRFP-like peptide receptor [Babylonia areolata]|uniref:QRFP-like peptide receptor n=1 Tax=Babylonia areolata TaxID=304850 RepID=UPI003FD52170